MERRNSNSEINQYRPCTRYILLFFLGQRTENMVNREKKVIKRERLKLTNVYQEYAMGTEQKEQRNER